MIFILLLLLKYFFINNWWKFLFIIWFLTNAKNDHRVSEWTCKKVLSIDLAYAVLIILFLKNISIIIKLLKNHNCFITINKLTKQ